VERICLQRGQSSIQHIALDTVCSERVDHCQDEVLLLLPDLVDIQHKGDINFANNMHAILTMPSSREGKIDDDTFL